MTVGSPEALFHTWYAGKASLTALVSDASVFTGDVQDQTQARPYVTIMISGAPSEHRSSGEFVEHSELAVDWFGDSWQDGKAFMDELKKQLHNTAISDTGIDCRCVRLTLNEYMQEPDEVWHFLQVYELDHEAS